MQKTFGALAIAAACSLVLVAVVCGKYPLVGQQLLFQVLPGRSSAAAFVLSAPFDSAKCWVEPPELAAQHSGAFALQLHRVLDAHPADADLWAGALIVAHGPDAYGTLMRRAPRAPVMSAALLRARVHSCQNAGAGRLYGNIGSSLPKRFDRAADARETLRLAQLGEVQDPSNAYFAAMQASALLRLGKDAEAVSSLERAARNSAWRDYRPAQALGAWRLIRAASGVDFAWGRSCLAVTSMEDDLTVLTDTARAAASFATRMEQSGKQDEGLRVRHSLMRLGRLMMEQGCAKSTNSFGIDVASAAADRPVYLGKAANEQSPAGAEQPWAWSDYLRDLNSRGHGGEYAYAKQTRELCDKTKALHESGLVFFSDPARFLSGAWRWSVTLLTAALISFAMAAACGLFYLWNPRLLRRLPSGAVAGVVAGVAGVCAIAWQWPVIALLDVEHGHQSWVLLVPFAAVLVSYAAGRADDSCRVDLGRYVVALCSSLVVFAAIWLPCGRIVSDLNGECIRRQEARVVNERQFVLQLNLQLMQQERIRLGVKRSRR